MVQVNLEDKIFSGYRVTLLNDRGAAVWSSESLKRSPNNNITIGFNPNFFQSANNTLKVEGGDKNTEITVIGNYLFQVLKKQ